MGGALLMTALATGCWLMWPLLDAGPLALDEHGSYWLVDSDLPGSALERSLGYAAIPPLSAWLQQAFLAAFGRSEFAFRLPSALCYLAAIGMTWWIATHLADRTAGGMAALLLAWHPLLDEVRIARSYGLLMLLSAVLLWCTVRWRRYPESWRWPAVWGAAAAGLMWTHYVALPLIGVAWLTLFIRNIDPLNPRIRIAPIAAASTVAAGMCLPLVPAILRMQEWSPSLNYMPEGQPWWKIIGPLWWAGLPSGIALTLLLRRLGPRVPIVLWRALLPAVWTLVPLACLLLVARGNMSSLANPRYQIPYAAGGACLVAIVLRGLHARVAVNCTAIIAVIGLTWSLADGRPWNLRRLGAPADAEWRDAARRIEEIGVVGEPVFVQSGLIESYLVPSLYRDELFLEYVGCRISRFYLHTRHPRIGLPYFWDSADMRAEFRKTMSLGDTSTDAFWIAAATDTDLNRASLAGIEQLAQSAGFVATIDDRRPNMTLLRYQHPTEAP